MTGIHLGPRERQILNLIAEGRQDHEIAAELFISHSTVKTWKATLYQKLGAHNGARAVHNAYQAGLLVAFGDDYEVVAEQLAIVRQALEMGYQLALVPIGGEAP